MSGKIQMSVLNFEDVLITASNISKLFALFWIGLYFCFYSFSLCEPPRRQPPPTVDGGDLPEVTVLVGTKLRYQIGYVRYNDGEEEFISSEVIGAISAITAILVSVGIVVLIVLKHKSTQVHNLFTFRAYSALQENSWFCPFPL